MQLWRCTNLQSFCHIVCLQNGCFWRFGESFGTHHGYVRVWDRQYQSWAPWCCRNGTNWLCLVRGWNATSGNLYICNKSLITKKKCNKVTQVYTFYKDLSSSIWKMIFFLWEQMFFLTSICLKSFMHVIYNVTQNKNYYHWMWR